MTWFILMFAHAPLYLLCGCTCVANIVGIAAHTTVLYIQSCTQQLTRLSLTPFFSKLFCLQARGFQVFVLDIQRTDWFKVARSLLSLKFYTTSCTTDPVCVS